MKRQAFTLVEMLLVVAILSLLIALLLPTLSKARGAAQEVQCKTQLRQVGDAMQRFALDNSHYLPGSSVGGWEGANAWQKCWVGKEGRVPGSFDPPVDGPLAAYLGGGGTGTKQLYRCPSLSVTPLNGGGSNGGFDFSMILSFGGARVKAIPLEARVVYMSDPFAPPTENLRTPIVVEENPSDHRHSLSIEPGFGAIDRMADHHVSRHSNYASIDGGVETYFNKASRPPQAWEWFVKKPNGTEVRLNGYDVSYNYWKTK